MKIERFQDIEAWKLARELTRRDYSLTRGSRFRGSEFSWLGQMWSELYVALEANSISTAAFQDVYEQARCTRAAPSSTSRKTK
jgi:hypothetical protein